MINRDLIRAKAFQTAYAFRQSNNTNLNAAEKELLFSLNKAHELYCHLLHLMVDITAWWKRKVDVGLHKMLPTEAERHPNTRFIDNKFIAQLADNEELNAFMANQKDIWEERDDFMRHMAEKVFQSEYVVAYMNADGPSDYEADRELWRKVYKNVISKDELIDELLEDASIFWNDDREIVDTFVLKTIKRFDVHAAEKQALIPAFEDAADEEFARKLIVETLAHVEENEQLITQCVKNWDFKRVALTDLLLLELAVTEIKCFPQIPLSVTMNEYVELAKLYSTRKSHGFVNGTLDGIVNQLQNEGKILKTASKKPY